MAHSRNGYVDGISDEIVERKEDQRTYKIMTLKDGNRFTIVKNYLSMDDLVDIFSRGARERFIKLHACGYLFFENDRGFSMENTAPSPLTPYHLFQPHP